MRVEITKQTVAAREVVRVGDVVDLPDSEARLLIRMKRAVPYAEAEEADDQPAEDGAPGNDGITSNDAGEQAPAAAKKPAKGKKGK